MTPQKLWTRGRSCTARLLGTYKGGGSTFGVRLIDDCALLINWDLGIEAVDVRKPTEPVKIGSFYDGGRPNGLQVVGNLIYLADGSDSLEIILYRKEDAEISR